MSAEDKPELEVVSTATEFAVQYDDGRVEPISVNGVGTKEDADFFIGALQRSFIGKKMQESLGPINVVERDLITTATPWKVVKPS